MAENSSNSEILQFIKDMFPEEVVTVGKGKLHIKAASFGVLSSAIQQLQALGESLSKQGVTWDNYETHENTVKIAVVVASDFTNLLSIVSGVDSEIIAACPPEVVLDVVKATVKVNLRSKDTLLKNWASLTESFKGLKLPTPPKKGEKSRRTLKK